ncbi:SDR family NAD(P)-dependent oxidoreductase [Eggerthellaceae bacterium zg-887]|nr:SDR family NAD(P)-dependent oxidoreductase [Xiamenia xianingshaonis]
MGIITGGGSGIGLAFTKLFCEEGATVIFFGYSDERNKQVEKDMQDKGYACEYVHCDVRLEDDCSKAIDSVWNKCGRIDFYFANAGLRAESSYRNGLYACGRCFWTGHHRHFVSKRHVDGRFQHRFDRVHHTHDHGCGSHLSWYEAGQEQVGQNDRFASVSGLEYEVKRDSIERKEDCYDRHDEGLDPQGKGRCRAWRATGRGTRSLRGACQDDCRLCVRNRLRDHRESHYASCRRAFCRA